MCVGRIEEEALQKNIILLLYIIIKITQKLKNNDNRVIIII